MSALPKVMIGMPIGSGSLPWPTASSLIATMRAADRAQLDVRLSTPVGSSMVLWARSFIVGEFLRSGFTHLFWIDSDLSWTTADFFRLVGFGAAHDIIGATYPLKDDTARCVVTTPDPDEHEINGLGNIRISSMAIGFTICKREVIEKVAADKPLVVDELAKTEYPDFFRVGRSPRRTLIGEDVAFFDDATALGFKAWLDPSITLKHWGPKGYEADVMSMFCLQDHVKEK